MDNPNQPIDRNTLLNVTIFVEAFLLLAATVWCNLKSIQLLPAFNIDFKIILWGAGSGLLLSISGLLTLWLGKFLPGFASLRAITLEQIAPLFELLNPLDLLVLAAISGFCEEILFRGVMQNQLGYYSSSIIFGLFHCPNLQFISYGLWVTAAGLFLGYLYHCTHSLWACILAHAVSNFLSLLSMQFLLRRQKDA